VIPARNVAAVRVGTPEAISPATSSIDRERRRCATWARGYNRHLQRIRPSASPERNRMLKPLLLGTCLTVALTGCISITEPRNHLEKTVNTALTGACLAAQLSPCTIESSAADKSKATEAKAAAVRGKAQRDSTAADEDAARRSSCLTDTGPRLPVSSSQCATYGAAYSGNDVR
jgi:hypothetical protein